eukprot:TRINITY_DN1455_c0_g2_i1.p1 TRINITY_DN1455_c0_g2~~TRINITY_DN1455_c0_g2_i1.p1  ORF type:complete len:192 (+),score=10.98 TRINITY_DN1455_c0_g2_i1:1233-1808(+)
MRWAHPPTHRTREARPFLKPTSETCLMERVLTATSESPWSLPDIETDVAHILWVGGQTARHLSIDFRITARCGASDASHDVFDGAPFVRGEHSQKAAPQCFVAIPAGPEEGQLLVRKGIRRHPPTHSFARHSPTQRHRDGLLDHTRASAAASGRRGHLATGHPTLPVRTPPSWDPRTPTGSALVNAITRGS